MRLSRSSCLLLIGLVLWTVILASFAIVRHDRLNSSAYDLAIQSQVIWNTFQGRPFASSLEVDNYLGDHVQPILILLSPLYFLWADVRILLIAQAVALGLGAIPVYRLAQRELASPSLALTIAAAYLLYPTIGFINRFDFHLIAFVIPLLLFALNAVEMSRYGWASGLIVLALLCKEEIGLTVAALGLYMALLKKRRRLGALWIVGGLTWSLLCWFVIIPYFRGGISDTAFRYDWLGADTPTVVHTLLTRPGYVLGHQLSDPLRQQFLLRLLLPVGYLSLLAPATLLIGLPCLGYNLLSSVPSQSSIYFHYMAPFIPFAFAAAIKGVARIQSWLEKYISHQMTRLLLVFWLVGGTVAAWLLDNPFSRSIDEPYYPVYALERHPDQAAFADAQDLVPPQASLATTMAYAPHFSLRPELDLFYHKGRLEEQVYDFSQADFLLLNLTDLRWWVNPRLYYDMVETAIGRDGYEAVYFRDDVALLARSVSPQSETGAVLQRAIELAEAGGKYAPTGQATIDWIVGRWLYPTLPPSAQPLEARFGGGPVLLGYEHQPALVALPGGGLCVTLYWQTEATMDSSYNVFVHLVGESGYVFAQRDNVPVLGFHPTSDWQSGQVIGDLHCFQVPASLSAGRYGLATGLYDPNSGERLALESVVEEPSPGAVLLTRLTVEPKE